MEPENYKASKSIKIFTVKEVNELLPTVNLIFENAFHINQRIKSLTSDIENLVSIWGKDVLEKGHVDNEYYFWMVSHREESLQELIKKSSELQSLGCIVKDVDSGLIDFYCDKEGELIFLCWKYGEDKIKYWHTVDGGFKTRMSISQLK